ncbi:MAG: hypothetical protein J2P53_18920, partial [Bradyrhizobiaceae bacterium]|nr:hypothetical protein [Bradyrhizobiaceae bacterium]
MPEQHDWRSADAYAYLDDAEPAVFAWEFLRRNAEYQQTYRSVSGEADASPELSRSQARRWGLRFAADPDLRADRACVVWLPELNPATVVVAPAPAAFTEASPISGLTPSFSRRATDGVYWLVEFESTRLPVVLIDG